MNPKRLIHLVGIACLAVFAILICSLFFPAVAAVVVAGKHLGVLAVAPLVLPEEEFQEKVLQGVTRLEEKQKTFETSQQKVLADLDRADKEVKAALEELTKVKKESNSIAEVLQKMQKAQAAVNLNARSSFRDPIARLCADEGLSAWLNAAGRAASMPEHYHKLPGEFRKVLEDGNAKMKSLTGVDSSLGQATIPTEYFNMIYDTLLEYGDWSSLGVMRVGARTASLPISTARPTYYWIGGGTGGTTEGSAITAGSFTGTSVTLSIQTLAAYLLAARELLADSSVDMAPYILQQLAQTIAYGMDFACFAADGGADQVDAGYIGLFEAASANTELAATAADGNTTMETCDLDDFQRVLLTVSPVVLKRRPRWWMHQQMIVRSLSVKDNNGRPIFQTYQEAPVPGSIVSILGFPVTTPAAAPTTNTAGSPIAVFGDPDGMAVGLRQDLELASSEHIKFAENMLAFRALLRAGVKLKTTTGSTVLKPFAVLTTAAS